MRKSVVYVLGMAASVALAGASFAGDKGGDKWKAMDTNSDGYITQAEHAAGAKKMFTEMDGDRDGRVTANEMEQSHDLHARQGAEHQASSEGRYDKGKAHKLSAAEKIKKIDANNDGVLTAAEHEQGSRRMFTEMDTDGDGRLSKDEMKKGHDRMSSKDDDKPAKY